MVDYDAIYYKHLDVEIAVELVKWLKDDCRAFAFTFKAQLNKGARFLVFCIKENQITNISIWQQLPTIYGYSEHCVHFYTAMPKDIRAKDPEIVVKFKFIQDFLKTTSNENRLQEQSVAGRDNEVQSGSILYGSGDRTCHTTGHSCYSPGVREAPSSERRSIVYLSTRCGRVYQPSVEDRRSVSGS